MTIVLNIIYKVYRQQFTRSSKLTDRLWENVCLKQDYFLQFTILSPTKIEFFLFQQMKKSKTKIKIEMMQLAKSNKEVW